VKYHNRKYPEDIVTYYREIAGHFDAEPYDITDNNYSLHTEYSFSNRKMASILLDGLYTITSSNFNGIPKLWFNNIWALEFIEFLKRFTNGYAPTVLEIHPPFRDYCPSIEDFMEIYIPFEEKIKHIYPETEILIENRCGSRYKQPFMISNADDLLKLTQQIELHYLNLRIAFDAPQFITTFESKSLLTESLIQSKFRSIKEISPYIRGLHLWGKKKNVNGLRVSHIGDLNTFFENNFDLKFAFLDSLYNLLDDNIKRFFVPEVNSDDSDLLSIIDDLKMSGFNFLNIAFGEWEN
jgi:hypothetical protein